MNVSNAAKRCRVVLLLIFCLLLSGCQKSIVSIFTSSEHTELVVDGEYQPFNVPRTTMEKLMDLVEAEDTGYIYEVFSPTVRESVAGLDGQIKEFICFIKEKVTDWDFLSGGGNTQRQDGVTTSTRSSFYEFNTDKGTYRCDIGEVLKNTEQPDSVGFSDITIYPEELSNEYAPKKQSGIYIVYPIEEAPQEAITEPYPLEILMELAENEDMKGIHQLFSSTAKLNSEEFLEQVPELVDFFNNHVTSWEPYTWTQNIEKFNQNMAATREMFFYLHTDMGLYRCDIREVLESSYPVDVGFSSVSIFPALYPGIEPEYEDEIYKENCTWGRENRGVCIIYSEQVK